MVRQALPQVHAVVLLPRVGGGEGSNGKAQWLAAANPHQCELGGADSQHAGSGRRKVVAASPTATFPTSTVMLDSELNGGDRRIWKEGDPWATMIGEYYWKHGDGW